MKSTTLFSALLVSLAFLGMSFTTSMTTTTGPIDLTQSQIIWKGYKVTGSHTGTINIKDANLETDNGLLTGGNFVIDMASLKCTDLQGKYAGKLEGHLKSDDFFGVANFPNATFNITKVASRGKAGEYKITGDLTIKDKTKSIKFNAVSTTEGGQTVLVADLTIDRSDFDVRYGSGSFFDNLGDKTIYDEFELAVRLVAK